MELLIILLLAACLLFVLGKWLALRRELRLMTGTIRQIHGKQGSRRVTVNTRDRSAGQLAREINLLYSDIDRDRSEHATAMEELRSSLANVSHDLRTPLTSILGYVKLLEREGVPEEEKKRYLQVIHNKANSLNGLIGNLFELTRLESGAYAFQMELLDAGEILGEELAAFYQVLSAGEEPPDLQLCDKPLPIIGDQLALSRIFSNLLQNMVKHGAKGIRITSGEEAGQVVLTFANRAENLTEPDVDRLFTRFFTADRMRSGENTGLGLSIVKEFVEQTGGTIQAELKEQQLTFALRWNRARDGIHTTARET